MKDYVRKPQIVSAEKITPENYMRLAKENNCLVARMDDQLMYHTATGRGILTAFGCYLVNERGIVEQMHAEMFESMYEKM